MAQLKSLVEIQIQKCVENCYAIINNDPRMLCIEASLDNVVHRMEEPMQLAIVGRISSSKSTLVNAILGKPEVVSTGHEAETFNVSWLKYGSNNSPIKVHFKNGTCVDVPREDWKKWTSHSSQEELKTKVQYLEIRYEDESLKTINIIDTPGLDAVSKVDSENTKAFLKKVNPDAVVMVFTKSLSDESLKLIEDFQKTECSFSYHINPMNALGVLSKVDLNWNLMNQADVLVSANDSIKRTLTSRQDVSKALFQVLPVSALLGLAAQCITDEDFFIFCSFAKLERNVFLRYLVNAESFVKEYSALSITAEARKNIFLKYGLYGVFVCVETIRNMEKCTKDNLSKVLNEKSGFAALMYLIRSHFGNRSSLIKAQKALLALSDSCNADAMKDNAPLDKINKIKTEIFQVEESLHELKEWTLLLDIYESKIRVDDDFKEEFKRVCGEYGYSALSKLGCSKGDNISIAIARAHERARFWTGKYNVRRILSHSSAEPYLVLSKSYTLLANNLEEQKVEYDKAIKALEIFKLYVYGHE